MGPSHLTVGDIARLYGVAGWQVRRVVDDIAPDTPRAGLYRLVPRGLLPAIAIELQKHGWFPCVEGAAR